MFDKIDIISINLNMASRKINIIIFVVVSLLVITPILYYHKNLIQSYNLNKIENGNLDGRLLPHRVNNFDKLNQLLNSGIRSFEIDLYFVTNNNKSFFAVGHDESEAVDITLDNYLKHLESYDLVKIWLDVKNISSENVQLVLNEFDRLDKLYNIKNLAIVETPFLSKEIKIFIDRGYHLSYYLPTEYYNKIYSSQNPEEIITTAEKLAGQLSDLKVSAVSFDLSLYPFVKNYIEPNISKNISYHTWGAIKIWKWGVIDEISKTDYFNDKRVKTILYRTW